MNATRISIAILAVATSTSALAQQAQDPLSEHPAVVVKRLYERQGYDYLSKFYPHPAWLYLLSEAPRPMRDHPAVIVFKRNQQEAKALAQQCNRPVS